MAKESARVLSKIPNEVLISVGLTTVLPAPAAIASEDHRNIFCSFWSSLSWTLALLSLDFR